MKPPSRRPIPPEDPGQNGNWGANLKAYVDAKNNSTWDKDNYKNNQRTGTTYKEKHVAEYERHKDGLYSTGGKSRIEEIESEVWRPTRNPLLEQMTPMPPPTMKRGRHNCERVASYDPLRGGFWLPGSSTCPTKEVKTLDRRAGRKFFIDPGQPDVVRDLMDFEQNICQPMSDPFPKLKKPAPKGTRLGVDMRRMLVQKVAPTEKDKAIMQETYQRGLERSLRLEGAVESLSWRDRRSKQPLPPVASAPPVRQYKLTTDGESAAALMAGQAPPGPGRREMECTLARGGGSLAGKGNESSPLARRRKLDAEMGRDMCSLLRMLPGRRKGEVLGPGLRGGTQLPPSFSDGPRVPDLLDESKVLAVPVTQQRRHLPGSGDCLWETLRLVGDQERRTLNARDLGALTRVVIPIEPPVLGSAGTAWNASRCQGKARQGKARG
ncbi:unnamed protein product [Discosporangium mesarthrocarpum]